MLRSARISRAHECVVLVKYKLEFSYYHQLTGWFCYIHIFLLLMLSLNKHKSY